jgi:hypothetical protein
MVGRAKHNAAVTTTLASLSDDILIAWLKQQAGKLVEKHSRPIHRFAFQLLEHQRLGSEQIRKVLEQPA